MLVGRESELRAVDGLLAAAQDGRGASLLVTGPAGIGKTALLAAVRDKAAVAGLRVLYAAGGELEHDLPFAVVRQLLEPVLRVSSPAARDELFASAAGLARPVFEPVSPGEEAASSGGVTHGLYWVCANLADSGPLLLVIDDAPWADEASLRFLVHLARRIGDLPVLLVLASRPTPPDHLLSRALEGLSSPTLLLQPLTTEAVGTVVRSLLPGDADDEFCAACATTTGGNPFLLTEAMRTMRAEQIRPVAAEVHRIEQLRPQAVARSVLGRLARLGQPAVALARAVAVLGPAAQSRHVAALADLPVRRVAELIDELAAAGIVTGTRPIEFLHPLVRTAVYTDASELLRASDHKRAALLLHADGVPADHLAPHLLAAEPEGDPWIVHRLRDAAAKALTRGAVEVAAACLQRATAEPPMAVERPAVFAELGRCLGMANRPEPAAEAFRAAYELTEKDGDRVDIAFQLGALMIHTGRGAEAVTAFDLAHAAVDGNEAVLESRLLPVFLMAMATIEPPAQWIARLDAILARNPASPDPMLLASLAFGAAATGDRSAAETARLADLAVTGTPSAADGWQLANLASSALAIADRNPHALAVLDRAIDAARSRGNLAEFGYLALLRSHTALFAGRLLEAEADGRAAVDLSDDGSPQDTPMAVAVLAEALLDRGRADEAQRLLTDRDLDGELHISLLSAHFVLQARGRLRLRQGRYSEAVADLRRCGGALAGAGYVNPAFAPWRAEAAMAHLHLGELDTARALAAEDLQLARRYGAPFAIGTALRVSGLIEGGPAGLDLLAEAVQSHHDSTAHLSKARALAAYGAALRRAGHKTQAQPPLRDALDLATRCGAADLAERARAELTAAGARPRRARHTGPESLTASELRVARLAAAGATNRDIAQSLFVSQRTVEIHLSHAYRKLGIDTRQQLTHALAALPTSE